MRILTVSLLALFITQLFAMEEKPSSLGKPFGSTVAQNFSDHEAICADIPIDNRKTTIRVLSYNTWARGSLGGFDGVVNGYGDRKEPNADGRIQANIVEISDFLNNNQNAIVCLQEIADADLNQLTQLGDNIQSVCKKTKGQNFNNCILYKTISFSLKVEPSISQFDNLQTVKNNKTQDNRYQHVRLIHRKSLQTVDLVNLHLFWYSEADDIIKAIDGYFQQCVGTCVVVGDFNQDLSKATNPSNKATTLVSVDGSVSATNGVQKKNTTDAIVYKMGDNNRILNIDDVIMFVTNKLQKDVKNSWNSRKLSFDDLKKLINSPFNQQVTVWNRITNK